MVADGEDPFDTGEVVEEREGKGKGRTAFMGVRIINPDGDVRKRPCPDLALDKVAVMPGFDPEDTVSLRHHIG
jgi:hypothetical protein